ncbi:unknown [Ruminococcus sp. CAG:60]|nr:unknown [Ruminococcus sp. CAG:60]
MHFLNLEHIRIGKNRVIDLQYLAVLRNLLQKVSVFSNVNAGAGYDFLTDGIDWRVGYLCKKLFKVVKKWSVLFGKYSQWSIHAHCANAFCSV